MTVPIKREFTPDLVLSRVQDHFRDAILSIFSKFPILGGRLVKIVTAIPTGSSAAFPSAVTHGLGRIPQGYIVVSNPQNLSVSEDSNVSQVPTGQMNFLFTLTTNSPSVPQQSVTFWFF